MASVLAMESEAVVAPEKRAGEPAQAALGTAADGGRNGLDADFDGALQRRRARAVADRHEQGRERIGADAIQGVLELGIAPDGVQIRAPRWRCIPAGVARVLVGEEKIAQVEMTALITVGVVPELGTDFRAYPGRDIVGA